MAYVCDLGSGQKVYIDNSGMQTAIALISSSPGQQQQASSSFQTGPWVLPPTAFRTVAGVVLRIESQQGQQFVLLQANGIQVVASSPPLTNAEVLPLQQVATEAGFGEQMMPPMTPMKPMTPLKMGDMEMQMKPMQMRMGSMSMQMGDSTPAQKRFCSQCGAAVGESDRFCSSCGHRL